MNFRSDGWGGCRLNSARSVAESRGGVCLSKKYVNNLRNLKWCCSLGHVWCASYHNVIDGGKWCPVCGSRKNNDNSRHTLDQCIKTASERQGFCLSKSYKDNKSPLRWKCKFGHEWNACYHNVLDSGTWCPYCNVPSIGESISRKIFEIGFNAKFVRCRPIWLVNRSGYRLELDGYNDDLKIAFEYNGLQHKKEIYLFHRRRGFLESVANDDIKKKLCKRCGVFLIIIDCDINFEDISKFIFDECIKLGLDIDKKILDLDYKKFDLYFNNLDIERSIVESKGGILLSDRYINCDSKLDVVCDKGHIFSSTSSYLKQGTWCKYCYLEKRYGHKYNKLGKRLFRGEDHCCS